jgi:hypothetical protein
VDYVKRYVKLCFFLEKNGSLGFEHHETGFPCFPDALRLSSLMGDRAKKPQRGIKGLKIPFETFYQSPSEVDSLTPCCLFQGFSTALGMRSED